MAREIPEAVRAAAGLAATVLDEARRLPETLPGLPVRVLGLAMQLSMKLQQSYAGLVARGDELFTGLRGENEPGMATFDDDEPSGTAGTTTRVGQSAFDRVPETVIEVTDDADTAAADHAIDELAFEELVDEAALDEAAPEEVRPDRDADGLPEPQVLDESPAAADETALSAVTAEVIEGVDVPGTGGGVNTVEGIVTDEGVAVPEPAAAGTAAAETAAPEAAAAEPAAAAAPAGIVTTDLTPPPTPPVEGYDDWSIAQLRGRLRGYAPATVQQLLDYEQATRAREPYLRMLRNRLERVSGAAG
jgi:hypothetical protein